MTAFIDTVTGKWPMRPSHPLPSNGDAHLWIGRPAPVRLTRAVAERYLGPDIDWAGAQADPSGAPLLRAGRAGPPLRLCTSTTRDRSVVAATCGTALGIDVERIRPVLDVLSLAAETFGAEAAVALGALPRDRRARAFLQAWTRLRAVVKADRATGATAGRRHRIAWSPDADPIVLTIDGDRERAQRIDVRDLDLGAHHVGAVALVGRLERIQYCALDNPSAAAAA